jgi:hypothetical protein
VSNKYSDFLAVNHNNIVSNESKKLQQQKQFFEKTQTKRQSTADKYSRTRVDERDSLQQAFLNSHDNDIEVNYESAREDSSPRGQLKFQMPRQSQEMIKFEIPG